MGMGRRLTQIGFITAFILFVLNVFALHQFAFNETSEIKDNSMDDVNFFEAILPVSPPPVELTKPSNNEVEDDDEEMANTAQGLPLFAKSDRNQSNTLRERKMAIRKDKFQNYTRQRIEIETYRNFPYGYFESNLVVDDPPRFSISNERIPTQCFVQYPTNPILRFNNIHWQEVQNDIQKSTLGQDGKVMNNWQIYIYSAFYDNRPGIGKHPHVRILGGIYSPRQIWYNQTKLYCQFWFEELDEGRVSVVSSVRPLWYPSSHKVGRKGPFLAYMFTCPYKWIDARDLIPFAVSLVPNKKCERAVNKVNVIHWLHRPPKNPPHGFGVCVKGLDFPTEDISQRLVEWFELLRILGVSKVHTYLLGIHPNVSQVVQYYTNQGFLQIGPVTLPGKFPNDPYLRHQHFERRILDKRHLEILLFNDCLYRNMYEYEYISMLDVDEVIIPLGKFKTWNEFMKQELAGSTNSSVDSFQVKQIGCFFHGIQDEKLFPEIPSSMHMLQHVHRIERNLTPTAYATGTKSFLKPARIISAFNHWPQVCLHNGPAQCRWVFVNETKIQLFHYKHIHRFCGVKRGTERRKCTTMNCLRPIKDLTLWKYKSELVRSFKKVMKSINWVNYHR